MYLINKLIAVWWPQAPASPLLLVIHVDASQRGERALEPETGRFEISDFFSRVTHARNRRFTKS